MNDALKTAIEELTRKLEARMREVADLKRAINTFAREAGEEPPYADAEPEAAKAAVKDLRPDRFFGKSPTTAAREFLEAYGKPASAEQILEALRDGAFDFDGQKWKDEFRLKNLAISLSKNSSIFTRLPNGLFGLSRWYPGARKPTKARPDEEEPAEAGEGSQETDGDTDNT